MSSDVIENFLCTLFTLWIKPQDVSDAGSVHSHVLNTHYTKDSSSTIRFAQWCFVLKCISIVSVIIYDSPCSVLCC
jgi:hypothetical protein